MHGPSPKGHWTTAVGERPYRHLVPGRKYRVAQAFVDYDDVAHPEGETWWFLGHNHSAYHDGLSLFVSLDGEHEWHIRLSTHPADMSPALSAFETFVVEG